MAEQKSPRLSKRMNAVRGKVSVSSTMGTGVRVDTSGFAQSAANA